MRDDGRLHVPSNRTEKKDRQEGFKATLKGEFLLKQLELRAACRLFHTDDEDTRAGSDARDHIGGDTLPFSVVLLAERQKL